MLDPLAILKEAKNDFGSTATFAQVETEIAKHDYQALCNAERGRYRVELYDKVTQINGVAPEVIMSDVPADGEVYLIYVDGNLTFLQKHDPNQAGFAPMDAAKATEIANNAVDSMVEQAVDAAVKPQVLRALL
ncbi:hypothetical protein EV586_101568 [Tumebacillus sp. BK434]|uniref:hypothetical protein n=1 Tax=Tumebacillus sp. BK434 TaxID=2512169 RepID=UPI001052051C|nr:hypothetical protein [Tumebacillus sp. BK434]TCP59352.1 hypothetical protein EV586_101568 [Tumebacillus sp. BK434]